MLHIVVPPDRSGFDIFSSKTIETLISKGIPASLHHSFPKSVYRFFNAGRLPFGRRFFRLCVAPLFSRRILQNMNLGDIAWVQSFCVPGALSPNAERFIQKKGVSYIFHLMDNWFDIEYFRQGTINRCKLADLVAVPTPQLAQKVKAIVPNASVAIFEEPIDLDRLAPTLNRYHEPMPIILWCGNPFNLSSIQDVLPVLRRVHKKIPFVFRVICGEKPPPIFTEGLNFEWTCFEHNTEARLIAGSWFGIAPMADTPYTKCKGAYKVKTYLASGLPVVASAVGFQAELIRAGGKVGFLPESPKQWEDALLMLLKNPSLCSKMSGNALNYAENRFSYPAAVSNWIPILQKHFPKLKTQN